MRILAGGPTRGTGSAHEQAWERCIRSQDVPGVDVTFYPILAGGDGYEVTEEGHTWGSPAIARVAQARQQMIEHARSNGYDAVWMVDDDVLCGPHVLAGLLGTIKGDAVAVGVYWTAGWDPSDPTRELPQVWQRHSYGITPEVVAELRAGQSCQVAGGGACTLIHGEAMSGAVYWPPLMGVEHWWEDRWACLRWAAREVPVVAVAGQRIHHAYTEAQRTPEAIQAAVEGLGTFGPSPAVALPTTGQRKLPPLILALPWYGGVCTRTAACALKLASAWESMVYLSTAERSQVEIARDLISHSVATSAAPDHAVVLWLDADMTFNVEDIARMVANVEHGEIVGAAGRQKIETVRFCARELDVSSTDRRGWVRGHTGGAVVAMTLGTLRALHRGARAYTVGGAHLREVWPTGIGDDGQHLSEDFGMFAQAERLGVVCWVDPWVTLGHLGEHEFGGRLADALMGSRDNPGTDG